MKPSSETQTEKTLAGATAALRRAARRARMVARRTGTPLVLGKDGRIEKRWLEGEADGQRGDSEKYPAGAPDITPPENDRLE